MSMNGYPHPVYSLRPDFGTGTRLWGEDGSAASSETISPAQEVGSVALRAECSLARCRGGPGQATPSHLVKRNSNGPAMRANAKARPLDGGQAGGRNNRRQKNLHSRCALVSDERQLIAGRDHEREARSAWRRILKPAKT
jgi:hypothetical protein